ncbi:MAG: NADH-quinone oxidoreductase subunit N [Chloroflexi bacterium]|nr:NADH-quinone oxidoreductase subunit N [Chloroflexota bacterium]
MTAADVYAILPLIVLGGASVVVLLGIAVHRSHSLTLILTLTGLVAAFLLLPLVSIEAPRQVTPLLVIDSYSIFFSGLIIAASFIITVLSYSYLSQQRGHREEFYLFLLLATLGSVVLVASTHFASFFLGLEVLSVSLYTLIAYSRKEYGIEAGVKYLILAGLSSAFLLFGMALVYSELGTMKLAQIPTSLSNPSSGVSQVFVLGGLALIVVGIGFKLALVPFHLWTPDVYQGAPAPVTAFVATISKGAMFALLLRYFTVVNIHNYPSLYLAFVVIAIASMFIGNLLGLLQTKLKRLLAYSSISHLGYLLVAFLASGPLAAVAVAFYLVTYFVTTLGAFGLITIMSNSDRDAEDPEDYRGLFWRKPWIAGSFTAMLLSLAGVPLTAGFVGKFYLVTAGIGSALWLLVIVLVVTSGIGLYYYLRVVVAMFASLPKGSTIAPAMRISPHFTGALAVTILVLLLFWLGIYPTPILRLIESMVTGFS